MNVCALLILPLHTCSTALPSINRGICRADDGVEMANISTTPHYEIHAIQ